MEKTRNRFWDFHYVGFGNAPVPFGDVEVLLDVRGWEAVCSPVSSGTEAWCWFLENAPELRNGRKFSTNDYSRQEMQRQRKAVMRDVQETFRRGKWGRFMAFNPGGRYGRLRAMLYLRPDGTGYFRGVYCHNWLCEEPIEFTWKPAELGLSEPRDILTAPILGNEAQWKAFCRRVLNKQIAPRFADPLVSRKDLVDKPLRHLCGSEAELKQVTTWICHCHDDQKTLFEEGHANITYAPHVDEKSGGLTWVEHYSLPRPEAGGGDPYNNLGYPLCPPHLKTLLDLAFQHNMFEGYAWHPIHGWEHEKACCRKGDWQMKWQWCRVTILRPSAHERAESLLCLFDWLDGKVSPEEQRALLGLEDA